MTDATSTTPREPLGWCPTSISPDASCFLANAKTLAGSIVAIDGQGLADSLPTGILCTIADLLGQELEKLWDILDNGDMYAEECSSSA
jgi:hypothetical protein